MRFRNEAETEALLMSHYEQYYRLAYSYVKSEQDALDIVQESAYKAIKGCRKVKEPDYLATWIYRIVVNTSMDHLRKRREEPMEEEILEVHRNAGQPETSFSGQTEDRLVIRELLDQLSPEEKTVIILRYFEEKKIEEIAAITGEAVSTVKSRLYRTLRKLKTQLGDRWEESE